MIGSSNLNANNNNNNSTASAALLSAFNNGPGSAAATGTTSALSQQQQQQQQQLQQQQQAGRIVGGGAGAGTGLGGNSNQAQAAFLNAGPNRTVSNVGAQAAQGGMGPIGAAVGGLGAYGSRRWNERSRLSVPTSHASPLFSAGGCEGGWGGGIEAHTATLCLCTSV